MISKTHEKICATLSYIEHFLIFTFTITECISVYAFASLDGIPIWIASSAIWLKICVITAEIK